MWILLFFLTLELESHSLAFQSNLKCFYISFISEDNDYDCDLLIIMEA
jgi:hypothetical protein